MYVQAGLVVAHRQHRHDLTLAHVARLLCCSTRQLQRAYAQFGARSFQEELVERRMLAAAALLRDRDLPVAEVMRRVGYRHPAHFAATFRRRHGVTPARFRRRARVRP